MDQNYEQLPNVSRPLHEQRPPEVAQAIQKKYQENEDNPSPRGYLCCGEWPDVHIGPQRQSCLKMIEGFLSHKKRGEGTTTFIDIGAGWGSFPIEVHQRFPNIEVTVLNAPDFNCAKEKLAELNPTTGNAEEISKIYPPNSFDVVTCSAVLEHLTDPLGTITQLYEIAKPEGIIVISSISLKLPGVQDYLLSLQEHLQKEGYLIALDLDYKIVDGELLPNHINTLVIKKTLPHLLLPIDYCQSPEDHAYYSLNSPLSLKKLSPLKGLSRLLSLQNPIVNELLKENMLQAAPSSPKEVNYCIERMQKELQRFIDLPAEENPVLINRKSLQEIQKSIPGLFKEWLQIRSRQWQQQLDQCLK